MLVSTSESVSKTRFFADFSVKTFFVFTPEFLGKNRFFAGFALETFFFLFFIFYFLVFTPEFVDFCTCFAMKTFCFLVFTLEFEGTKFLCPPRKLFMPSQSRYSVAESVTLLVLNH